MAKNKSNSPSSEVQNQEGGFVKLSKLDAEGGTLETLTAEEVERLFALERTLGVKNYELLDGTGSGEDKDILEVAAE